MNLEKFVVPEKKMVDQNIIEVALSQEELTDRTDMPLFFLVGGADDEYLSELVGAPIVNLVQRKSIDPIPAGPYIVYASRALLPTTGYARSFPLAEIQKEEWPILLDLEKNSPGTRSPYSVEITWLIRALRRAEQEILAETLRRRLEYEMYSEKLPITLIPTQLSVGALSRLYNELSPAQRNYRLIYFQDDLAIQLPMTLGDTLAEIGLTSCLSNSDLDNNILLRSLNTSLKLLQM